MNKEVKSHVDFIKWLKSAPKSQMRQVIDISTKEQLQALVDVIYNVLIGNCPISTRTRSTLSKYKNILRQIVRKNSTKTLKNLFKKLIPTLGIILSEALKCL